MPARLPKPRQSRNNYAFGMAGSWLEFCNVKTLSLPVSCSQGLNRLSLNWQLFLLNYVILAFMFVIKDCLNIITFLLTGAFPYALYHYFSCHCATSPLQVFGFTVNDVQVLKSLFFVTVSARLYIGGGTGITVFVVIYMVMVCLHGALKIPRLEADEDSSCKID